MANKAKQTNKSILKIHIPATIDNGNVVIKPLTLPIYVSDFESPIYFESGSKIINAQAAFEGVLCLESKLNVPTEYSSFVPNYSFEATSGSIPQDWDSSSGYTSASVIGLNIEGWSLINSSNGYNYMMGNALIQKAIDDYCNYTYLISSFFNVVPNSPYDTSISFYAKNSELIYPEHNYYEYSYPEEDESFFTYPEHGAFKIEIPKSRIKNKQIKYETGQLIYFTEPIYGAYILWFDNNETIIGGNVLASCKGQTGYGIPIDDGYTPLIWKLYKNTIVAPGTATKAKVCIYNRRAKNPAGYIKDSTVPGFVLVDNIIMANSSAYIYKTFTAGSSTLNLDSCSYMDVKYPTVVTSRNELIWDSGSAILEDSEYYPRTGKPSTIENVGQPLRVGKESDVLIWQSWIPFYPDFSPLTRGAHITSASLIVTAKENMAYNPEKGCFVSAGFNTGGSNVEKVTTWEKMKEGTAVSVQSTAITQSWIKGEKYEIDVTSAAKAKFGDKTIKWSSLSAGWNKIALLLRDNGSSPSAYRKFSTTNDAEYTDSSPKLKIGYKYNTYNRKTLITYVKKDNPESCYYNTPEMLISGCPLDASPNKQQRILMYFDLSSVRGTITSGSVKLVELAGESSYGTTNTRLYEAMDKWDWYGACWSKPFGTGEWTNSQHYNPSGQVLGNPPVLDDGTAANNPPTKNRTITIPLNSNGVAKVESWKSNPSTNKGFLLKVENEGASVGRKYCSQNYENISFRPRLIVTTINPDGTYIIQEPGPPEDYTPPDGPTPPGSGIIQMVNNVWTSTGNNDAIINYKLVGEKNTNRYLLITEGWNNNNSQWGWDAKFNTLSFSGSQMDKVVEIGSDEANIVVWGIRVENSLEPGVNRIITGSKRNSRSESSGAGGRRAIPVYIREFIHVNQTNPIYSTQGIRNGANSATQVKVGGLQISYLAKGWVADALFMANPSPNLGIPVKEFSHQILENSYPQNGFSRFVPGNTGGNISFNWSWKRDREADYPDSGSDNALALISLAPE